MSWKRSLYYALSPKMRRIARRLYYWPVDFLDSISGRRDDMTPPKGKIFIGPGDFKTIGEKLKYDFIHYGGLKHGHHVLDIGSGIGRIAIPLTSYIDGTGSYNGFDIVEEGIEWCQKKISSKFSNFTFKHVGLHNDLYNSEDKASAVDFIFPYENEQFDFVILTSVFTHMQAEEVAHYLKEISRVMKSEALCFATFFVIDESSEDYLKKSEKPFFPYAFENYYLHDKDVKDANIAYRESFLKQMIADAGLTVDAIHPGWWAGREKLDCVDFQDVWLIKKQ